VLLQDRYSFMTERYVIVDTINAAEVRPKHGVPVGKI